MLRLMQEARQSVITITHDGTTFRYVRDDNFKWHVEILGQDDQWRRLAVDTDGRDVLWQIGLITFEGTQENV